MVAGGQFTGLEMQGSDYICKTNIQIISQSSIISTNGNILFITIHYTNNIMSILLIYRQQNNCYTSFFIDFANIK